ncbi:MAG: GntR family transcriptional regulator [Filimonas sp.]|nr:GntR family transcriptional regulator [Filimonas sp.]
MEFNENRAIYLQIAELICEKILSGHFKEDERIPSVREMAVQLEVNPNTVMRTFEFLQSKDIITNKRGIGYFVSAGGLQTAMNFRKEEFIQKELPQLFKTIHLLNMDFDELKQMYVDYVKKLPTH